MKFGQLWTALAVSFVLLVCSVPSAFAAGILIPTDSSPVPELVDHQVDVVLNNGFARTRVTQRFRNNAESPVDAIYEFPVPKDAALSEMSITIGERTLNGEVIARDEAESIYEDQRESGEQAGLATKNGYQTFEFQVANIPASGDATMSFVYYEPIAIDTAVGRYLYPLEDGGTRSSAEIDFWGRQESVTGQFTFDLELKSAIPIEEVRMPGLSPEVRKLGEGHYKIHLQVEQATLDTDLVFYYRFGDDAPGRVELIPYRADAQSAGTFMMIVTPGLDLAPLSGGHDLIFVLDISGSMAGKLETLKEAVVQALAQLNPKDRFRVVVFDGQARELLPLQSASSGNVNAARRIVEALTTGSSTNLYAGLDAGLSRCATERVSELVVVTDGVTNTGVVDPAAFDSLMRERDARVFGLLMGNNSNWPLMEVITKASGGFYAPVSNQDDIYGQITLANSKITHESLHNAQLEVSGIEVYDTTDFDFGKVYRGQQLVVFGRYDAAGSAELTLNATISGSPKTYSAALHYPAVAEANPELERLWALDMIHAIEQQRMLGLMSEEEAATEIRELGIEYQLVTDETAMIVLDDETFDELGIERNNEARIAIEHDAQANRAGDPTGSPSYSTPLGSGDSRGGALGLEVALLGLLALSGLLLTGQPSRSWSFRTPTRRTRPRNENLS